MSTNSSSSSSSTGLGFAGALTIAFTVLKLCGVIAWSWWWVLSPIWISFGIAIAILLLVAIGALVVTLWK